MIKNIKELTYEEETIIRDQIKAGQLKQIHLFNLKNMLMPRGSMEKESIGLYILDRLTSSYESWTNPKYADNPSKAEVLEILYKNMMNEVCNAWELFLDEIGVANEKN
jgi:hypothetical protein